MHDAAGHHHVIHSGCLRMRLQHHGQQLLSGQTSGVKVHLQRTDAGRQVDDAVERALGLQGLEGRHQHMHAQTQLDVEHQGAKFDQHIAVAGLAHHQGGGIALGGLLVDDGADAGLRLILRHSRQGGGAGLTQSGQAGQGLFLLRLPGQSLRHADAMEANRVARAQLAHLPQLGLHDHGGADKAAEARAIGAENHRHVAREVDGTNGIGIVVDVGRVQARLTPIGARPCWLGPDQAHARAAGVVVNLPVRIKEGLNVFIQEEVWRPMGAIQDANVPMVSNDRHQRGGRRHPFPALPGLQQMQHVAHAQGAAGMPAKLAQGEGTAAL